MSARTSAPTSPRRRRISSALLASAVLAVVAGLLLPGASPAVATGAPTSTAAGTAKTFQVHAVRQFTAPSATDPSAFTTTTASENDVSMTVSTTTDLRSRQEIAVTWSGAHPTGAVASDSNYGVAGSEQEYPFVLLQCRGQGAQVSPETCWTQSSRERFVSSPSATVPPVWRVDAAASAADRAPVVGAPDPRPADCGQPARSEHWLPFVSVDDTTYYGGNSPAAARTCSDFAPTSSDQVPDGIPNNTTYGITNADGRGSADFDVWTKDDSANLGCTATVRCSLVAIPIVGLSCDGYFQKAPAAMPASLTARNKATAESNCEKTGSYAAGEPLDYNSKVSDLAVSGQLWWSASNWANRIQVPLSFAPDASVCSVAGSADPTLVYGSVMMTETTAQWEPTFCTTKGYSPFVHVQTSDAASRTLVNTGTITMALGSRAPDTAFLRPVVQAPVALTGWAIAYNIDGADGQPYTSLRLDARLLAKLLSESYPGDSQRRSTAAYPAIAGNPATIVQDPEFQALNPDLPKTVNSAAVNAASALMALSSDADLTYALSSYLNDDPEARKWLDGTPDPWGMTVNPTYKGITLPVESWPLNDPWELTGTNDVCYNASPAPYLGLIANPVSLVSTIVTHVQFGIPDDQTTCSGADTLNPQLYKLTTPNRLTPGTRFTIGVVPLTAAHRFGLTTAALQTTASGDLTQRFGDTTGRTFVAPDDAGLKAGAALLKPDADTGVWSLDYDSFHQSAGSQAYPGTVPVFADVPTSGLKADQAARAAQILDYAAGAGQTPGSANGELPPGALPMTTANGLGALAAYTTCAADAVRAQKGTVPVVGQACTAPSTTPSATPTATPSATPSASASASAGAGGGTSSGSGPGTQTGSGSDVVATSPSGSTPPTATGPKGSRADTVATSAPVLTLGQQTALGRVGFPLALLLALLLGLLGAAVRWGDRFPTLLASARSAAAAASGSVRR